MAIFIVYRVFDLVLQEYFDIISDVEPTDHIGNPIDIVQTAIRNQLGAEAVHNHVSATLQKDDAEPFVRVLQTSFTTVGEFIFSGTNIWLPTAVKAIMSREDATNFCTSLGGDPAVLRMEYTGEGCGATQHSQNAGKVTCSGTLELPPTPTVPPPTPLTTVPPASVRIVSNNKSTFDDPTAKTWFDGFVSIGDLFDIEAANGGATKMSNDTRVHVLDPVDDTVLQTVKFHTSCSQPLFSGDQFGSVILRGFVSDNGASLLNGNSNGFSFRLFDLTNGKVVGEIPFGGGTFALEAVEQIVGATVLFTDLPTTEAVIEIQVRKVDADCFDGKIYHVVLEE